MTIPETVDCAVSEEFSQQIEEVTEAKDSDSENSGIEWDQEKYMEAFKVNSEVVEGLKECFDCNLPPKDGSILYSDDKSVHPLPISTVIKGQILSSIDHLLSFKTLALNETSASVFSKYTLLRSSIEISSTSIWLMKSPSQVERVSRVMKLRNVNFDNFTGFNKGYHGGEGDEYLRNEIENARRNGAMLVTSAFPSMDFEKLVRQKYKTLDDVMAEADKLPGLDSLGGFSPSNQWKLCSSVAHGYDWGHDFLLTEEEDGSSRDVDMTTTHLMFRTAVFLICTSSHLYFKSLGYPSPVTLPPGI